MQYTDSGVLQLVAIYIYWLGSFRLSVLIKKYICVLVIDLLTQHKKIKILWSMQYTDSGAYSKISVFNI